jgi:uncharacterized membrane protein
MLKYTHWIGVAAAILLVVSCYMPWAWYPDLNMSFTGFFSYKNYYGKPGKLLQLFAGISVCMFLLIRYGIRRAGTSLKVVVVITQIIIALILFTYALKNFITYSRCYSAAVCPERLTGIYLMLFSAALLMVMSLLPDIKLENATSQKK